MRFLSLPGVDDLRELRRPWKLLSFVVSMAALLYGAVNFRISDWDVGITLIMGTMTYLLAPLGVRAVVRALRNPAALPVADSLLALFLGWLVVDGVYVAYHTAVGNHMLRAENLFVSSMIYVMAGLCWLYRGSLRELLRDLEQAFRAR